MRDRVDRLGVSEPEIRTQGNDQITIQLPGVKDPETAAKIIGKTAQLELYDLEANLVPPSIDAQRFPVAKNSVYELLAGQQALAQKGTPDQYWLFNKQKKLVVGPVSTRKAALAKHDGKVPDGWKLFAVPPGTVVVSCGIGEVVCPGVNTSNPTSNYYYLFKYSPPTVPEMTGSDLKLSGTRQDFDPQTNQPIVTMQFTKKGAKTFAEITRAEAQRGKLLSNTIGQGQEITQHFAIVLDREIKSWPSIDWKQYPGGISGRTARRSRASATIGEAKNLALVLQTGALPVEFVTLDQTAISATLGKDSLNEAKKAALVGLLLVALFLLLFYRFLGLVAVLGLGIYAALPLRRDPDLQRDADAPGLRRPRADARGGRRRERRHLRTHQGRGARRAQRPGRDPDRLHEGLPHDRRRQRRHGDHRARALRRRDLVGARASR